MLNKFISNLKEPKKKNEASEPTRQIMMPVDEFFSRTGFEIDTENVWKMTGA